MTRTKLTPLQDLRAEAERLGIRWQPFGVCRRKLSNKIEAELKRRNDRDDREEAWHRRQDELRETPAGRRQIAEELEQAKIAMWEGSALCVAMERGQRKRRDVEREEAIGEWIRIVHGVEPDEGAPEVADRIARMGEQIEALRESEAAKDRQIAGQEQQLKELVAEMFHLEHARDVARKHAQERGRAMYGGPRTQLDRLGEVERRLAQIEDTGPVHEFRAAGSAIRKMLDRRDRGK